MPRIPTSALRKACAIDALLPRLLAPCRDLRAAQNELRWLREHVDKVAEARRAHGDTVSKSAFLRDLVKQRASGKPLQYLLGTEFFGDLEIRCRPGVLIPRQDTATAVQRLVRLVRKAQNLSSELRVLDLCTGTGCIPLLFHHELYAARADIELRALGIDISDKALRLADHNHDRLRRDKTWADKGSMRYMQADVLANPFADAIANRGRVAVSTALRHARLPHIWDILISNPPYISPAGYWKTTTRSVRGFEPKLALVPPLKTGNSDAEHGDRFYLPILNIAIEVEAKIVLLEVADLDQALRVARAAQALRLFDGIEIWREQPDEPDSPSPETAGFRVLGQGNARSVVCWRGTGAAWLGKSERACAYEDVALPDASLGARFQVAPVSGLHQSEMLHPYWVKHLNEQQKAVKHNVWRDLETTAVRPDVPEERPVNRLTTEERKERIIQEYLNGSTLRTITDAWGITPCTLYRYLDRSSVQTRGYPKRLTKEQQKLLVQYYKDGWKMKAIADVFKIHPSTVHMYLDRCSVPRRPGRGKRFVLNEEQHRQLVQYYKDGWTMEAIADTLGICKSTGYKYLDRPLGSLTESKNPLHEKRSRTRRRSASETVEVKHK
ncbi:S-adenosyl-L-methionine-dependent methyltransferase [Karstenula rhodostoma CBS 690.94]|uniref:S-adenosyl-L-methionine-dependent methyltransferase n=1 Tax=Karstenula rhodostoma CBS 690.94 TaxID=1392251 RepID=A0A9P4PIK5_9PLEO|nr:S-adenosyl-L-methionine-dependent methyltransferase [Karstenula rhodostoma CBS 690.94]